MRSAPLPYRGFPEDSAAKYRAAGIWRDETLPGFWRSRAAKFANNLALVARDSAGVWQRLSYRELNHAAESVAARLHRAGVRPGDRVVLALPNTAEFLSGVLGAFLSGAIPVFALPSHRETELVRTPLPATDLGPLAAKVLLISADAPRAETWLDGSAWQKLTSGTFQVSGVPCAHGEMLRSVEVGELMAKHLADFSNESQ